MKKHMKQFVYPVLLVWDFRIKNSSSTFSELIYVKVIKNFIISIKKKSIKSIY